MIMCVLLCYPLFIHMSQLLSTGRPISSLSWKQCEIEQFHRNFDPQGILTFCQKLFSYHFGAILNLSVKRKNAFILE